MILNVSFRYYFDYFITFFLEIPLLQSPYMEKLIIKIFFLNKNIILITRYDLVFDYLLSGSNL